MQTSLITTLPHSQVFRLLNFPYVLDPSPPSLSISPEANEVQLGAHWTREAQIPSSDARIVVLPSQFAAGTSSDMLFNLSVPTLCLKKTKKGWRSG